MKDHGSNDDNANRRDTIRVLGAAGVAALLGCRAENGAPGRGGTGGGGDETGGAGSGGSGGAGGAGGAGGRDASAAAPDTASAPDAATTAPDSAPVIGDAAPLAPDGSQVSCVVRPQQDEGPYFIDEKLNRSDIRPDPSDGTVRPGAELRLQFRVYRVDGMACIPLEGAMVDLWHADAAGVYSDAKDINGLFDSRGKKFLRGHQLVNAGGTADFITVYPGWYPGRSVHIHFKIRTKTDAGRNVEYTTQLYFPDPFTDEVHKVAPYAKPGRRMRNDQDGIYGNTGRQLTLAVMKDGDRYAATWDIGLRIT